MTMNIQYVLPVKGGGGGAHSVAQEMNELVKFGVNARVAVNAANAPSFMTNYADLPNVRNGIDVFTGVEDLAALISHKDLVVCTIFTSVDTVARALELVEGTPPRVAYYIQDYEPLFCAPDDELRDVALTSYTRFRDALLFAKTDWIRDIVTRNHGVAVEKVSPSLDTSLYYPSVRRDEGATWIAAMIRPHTSRRAPRRTMSVLKEIDETYGEQVNISLFGCSDEDIVKYQLPSDFRYTNHGFLGRQQVAALFRSTDLVLDLSDYQAFGRTGLEAMACGCATILPVFGGTHEYAEDGVDSLLVDTRSKSRIVERFGDYMAMDCSGRYALRDRAIRKSQRYSISNAAWSELELFSRYLAA